MCLLVAMIISSVVILPFGYTNVKLSVIEIYLNLHKGQFYYSWSIFLLFFPNKTKLKFNLGLGYLLMACYLQHEILTYLCKNLCSPWKVPL